MRPKSTNSKNNITNSTNNIIIIMNIDKIVTDNGI